VQSGTRYELVWEAFAETKGNPGPEVVRNFLERFGVEKPMETLSQSVGQTISTPLKSFIDVRNECAHNGQANQTPVPSEVLDYCDLLEKTAKGIVDTLAVHQPVPTLPSGHSSAPPAVGASLPVPPPTTSAGAIKKSLLQKFLGLFKWP
jgi:RiboL-PSP-HEPN